MTERVVSGLLSGGWRLLAPEPFREGIMVRWLSKGEAGAPTVAILEYAPGAGAPRHRHTGLETIIVLEGIQSDENGDYPEGSLIFNPPGSEHSVWSEKGCAVFIHWDQPVVFIEAEDGL
ncbi:MAG: cupin domain-containing protein [Hyphomicrobiales bacterium]|nr:cupin domain-containing protein [Hyphomicrobiales bacterium]MDE2114389.1 cupin domain-containing protein [Hyphomicrobiales bacterium]